MQQYDTSSNHSPQMVNIDLLKNSLKNVLSYTKIDTVLESGTFLGLGSTKIIAETFLSLSQLPEFITLEASWNNWRKARKNLRMYPFVQCIWGLSVAKEEALQFIQHDEVLNNHTKYENVFIDGGDDPVGFYKREIAGEYGHSIFSFYNKVLQIFESKDAKTHFKGQDLLRTYLSIMKDKHPLILLDSSGGIGFLEFSILQETMKDSPYHVILDDIFHLKHFRSYEIIRNDPSFKIIDLNEEGGWLFAEKR